MDSDDRADMHGQGAIRTKIPPGTYAAVGRVLSDPVADRGVCGWALGVGRECRQQAGSEDYANEAEGGDAAHAEFLRMWVFYRSACWWELALLLLGVLRVGCGDGIIETPGEGVCVTSRKAGRGDGVANDDQERARMQGVDVDEELGVPTRVGGRGTWALMAM
jgi:hypothetical protein